MAATVPNDTAPGRTSSSPHLSPPTVAIGGVSIKASQHQRHPSIGSSFASHRVTRRKSMSATSGANIAAIAQALADTTESQPALSIPTAGHPEAGASSHAGKLAQKDVGMHGYPSPPSSLPTSGPLGPNGAPLPTSQPKRGSALLNGSAIVDGHAPEVNRSSVPRNRRASEGATSMLGGKARGRSTSELKCDKCGKGYKHSSCLTKHLWEHTPEWSYTSKLLISKHQQVQLLEAASILVSMNPTPPASSSGASNNEGHSSSSDETTPPPSNGLMSPLPTPRNIRTKSTPNKRLSSSGSISKSYTTPTNNSFLAGASAPTSFAAPFPNHIPPRPRPRAGSNVRSGPSPMLRPMASTEDDALAAAVELLSCSFHTPVGTPAMPTSSLPRGADIGSPPAGGRSYVRPLNGVVEMKKEEDGDVEMAAEEEESWSRRGRSEEEDDGVFGRMEE